MKLAVKAALYSGLVFPGAGLLVLRQAARAAIFGVPALIALIYMMSEIYAIAQRLANQIVSGELPLRLDVIYAAIHNAIFEAKELEGPLWIFIAAWIISIFSSYAAGNLMDQKAAAEQQANPTHSEL